MTEQMILGSGDLYIAAYTGTLPEDETLEVSGNQVGYIKGGASIEYKPEEYTINDDSNTIYKRYVISEEITFKTGVLSWNLETLKTLCAKCSYTDETTTKIRTLTLGGKGVREMDKYVVRFVHTKTDGKKIRITLVATASAGLSLAFAPDKETTVDAEFKAISHNSVGNQLIITEEYIAD